MEGLRWRKFDLHVHTPASRCFERPASVTDDELAESVIKQALHQDLAAIAVTDHMSAGWVDRIKAAAEGTPLTVFPGVELSVGGCHVVAIFDTTCEELSLNLLLGELGVRTEDYGSTEHPIDEISLFQVLDAIHKRDGLAVLAHIDCENRGAWHTIPKGAVKIQLFNSDRYDAVEVKGNTLPPELGDRGRGYRRRPPFYCASDNPCPHDPTKHCAEGIGSRFTYFKVPERPRLESLRQCFTDPDQRIRLPEQFTERSIPRLISLHVRGGFFGEAEFHFHRALHSIIGGKGVGKSLLVEFLRFALDDASSVRPIQNDHVGKLISQLGHDGEVSVEMLTSTGERYSVGAALAPVTARRGQDPAPYECTRTMVNADTGEEIGAQISKLFPIRAFSQGEIVEISREKSEQLIQLDAYVNLDDIEVELEDHFSALIGHLKVLLASRQAQEQVADLESREATLREQVRQLNKHLQAPILQKRETHCQADQYVKAACTRWDKLAEALGNLKRDISDWKACERTDDIVGDLIAQIQDAQDKVRSLMQRSAAKLQEEIENARAALHPRLDEWNRRFGDVEAEFSKYLQETGGDEKSLIRRRDSASRQLDRVKQDLAATRKLLGEWEAAAAAARECCEHIDAALHCKYERRAKRAEELTQLSKALLEISVDEGTRRDRAVQTLREAQCGLHTSTLQLMADALPSHRLVLTLLGVEDAGPLLDVVEQQQLGQLRSRVLALDTLTEYLETLARAVPEDTPSIEFRQHGGRYRPLEELSQGERCTALLALALLEGECPVVVDQPEDSLDVRAVWEEIVQSVRMKKQERQFIFTTHNPTIAVAGDSDCMTVLEPWQHGARKTREGAIDSGDVKDAVITHLEGGTEPYELRRRKYNIRP